MIIFNDQNVVKSCNFQRLFSSHVKPLSNIFYFSIPLLLILKIHNFNPTLHIFLSHNHGHKKISSAMALKMSENLEQVNKQKKKKKGK